MKRKKNHSKSNSTSTAMTNNKENDKKVFGRLVKDIKQLFTSKDTKIYALSTTILLLSMFIYGQAYLFFYGYYFGNNTPLYKAIINPVPFNYKSLILLGLFIIIILFVLSLEYIQLTKYQLIKTHQYIKTKKTLTIILLIITCLGANSLILYMFTGSLNNLYYTFKRWATLVPVIILMMLLTSDKVLDGIKGFILSYLLIVSLFLTFNKYHFFYTHYAEIFYLIFIIIFWLECILEDTYLLSIIGVLCVIVLVISYTITRISLVNSIILSITILFCLYLFLKKLFNKNNYLYIPQKSTRKYVPNYLHVNCKSIVPGAYEFIYERYITFIICNLLILACSFYFIWFFFHLGNAINSVVPIKSYDKIIFKSNNTNNLIIGNIVASDTNKFYIANIKKELIMIENDDLDAEPFKYTTAIAEHTKDKNILIIKSKHLNIIIKKNQLLYSNSFKSGSKVLTDGKIFVAVSK